MNTDSLNKRIILALDVDTVDEAKNIVNKLKGRIKFYKVGLQLFLVGGIDFLKWLKDQDVDIMLDLKFLDIPRTIDAAVNQIQEYVRYLTVHSQCSILHMISEEYRKKILGVTVLTCFENDDVSVEHRYDSFYLPVYENSTIIEDLVCSRTIQAYTSNCGGIILSGNELPIIRDQLETWKLSDFVLVVPGIQLSEQRTDDQKRITTLENAFNNGADYVVIGRPILKSDDMIKTVELAQEKISRCGIKYGIAQVPAVVHHLDKPISFIEWSIEKNDV